MIFLAVVGGVIIIAVGLAGWYDHRAKRRGWRVGPSTGEAFQHRMDVESMNNPMVQGGKEDWMTWRQRDRK
jgi:hypothetical protein